MTETELKFQVPSARRRGVAEAVAGRSGGTRQRLQAVYLDTEDRALARCGVALRLRREGRRWVQTLKAAGSDRMQRLEHNVPRTGTTAAPPPVDPALHDGTPAGERLAAALREAPDAVLRPLYRTDVHRLARTLRTRGGTLEIAFDEGHLLAGERRLPVCELEIELLRGAPQAVLAQARRWVARHGLWLDVRSKAERGDLLARGEEVTPAAGATPPRLATAMPAREGRRGVIAACAEQVLANASQVASGGFRDEHVHQLRVGLRRLRTALRLFDGTTPDPLADGAAALFRLLGAARDQAAIAAPLQAELARAMAAAGLPLAAPMLPADASAVDPAACVRAAPAQDFLLALIEAVLPAPDVPADVVGTEGSAAELPTTSLRDLLAQRLQRWHKQVAADAGRFATLEDEARHRLRKRVKRLRYAVEFAATLFDARRVRRYLKPLRALQDRLGVLNDLAVGLQGYRGAAAGGDAAAAFATGWLAARRERLLAEAGPALQDLAKAKRFWRR
ncbi:MAG: CYTH and CHAD domain-containing protein [Piscinibacter sp.]|nr:CYTH and CHAD domain-containing protein [Piscinibacter sp.]